MRANLFIMRFHNGLHSNKCASFTADSTAPGNFYNFDAIFLMMRGRVVLFLPAIPCRLWRVVERKKFRNMFGNIFQTFDMYRA